METLKNRIKSLAKGQSELKNQRKTINLVGERKIHPGTAAVEHKANRDQLRHLNLAYGILRGKSIEEIEGVSKNLYDEVRLNKLVEFYKPEFSEKVVCISA